MGYTYFYYVVFTQDFIVGMPFKNESRDSNLLVS